MKRVDFRKAHDGLCALVRDEFKDDPFTGDKGVCRRINDLNVRAKPKLTL